MTYYLEQEQELLHDLENEILNWGPILLLCCGRQETELILRETLQEFKILIPQIPFIGGDKNHLTGSLIGAVRYLALYKSMKRHGKTTEETGKVLFDAETALIHQPTVPIPVSELMTADQLMERRRIRAQRSQERHYPEDYVYKFVPGNDKFDYGYDFVECAVHKFFHAQDAEEFTPFYCYLDYPKCRRAELGLVRTKTLAEGNNKCNHRFKIGGNTKLNWPPPFSESRKLGSETFPY
jgi:hypothetical protein